MTEKIPPPYASVSQLCTIGESKVELVPGVTKVEIDNDADYYKFNAIPLEDEYFTHFPAHLEMNYSEVFGDPQCYYNNGISKKLAPINKKVFGTIFEYTQTGTYYFFTLIIGIFLSFFWGLAYGANNFVIVWAVQPTIKFYLTWLRVVGMIYRPAVRVSFNPVFEGMGQMFRFIKVKAKLHATGLSGWTVAKQTSSDTKAIKNL